MSKPIKQTSRTAVVLNRDSGTLKDGDAGEMADRIKDILREAGHEVVQYLVSGAEIADTLKQARDTCDRVFVGGGDGTISSAASIFAGSDTPLAILPLGTMNLFARALAIPLTLDEAVRALANGEERAIDVGDVNGEIFVHHVTLGLHPLMIFTRERQQYASRLGKKWASLKVWWKLVRRAPRMRLRIAVDSDQFFVRTASVIIANNEFVERVGGVPHSETPDRGRLALYVANTRDWTELLAMSAEAGLGKWASNSKLDFHEGRKIVIVGERPRMPVSVDGELISLTMPIEARIRPQTLKVIMPVPEGEPELSLAVERQRSDNGRAKAT
jgi:diacylglycerol kinase family enzyme